LPYNWHVERVLNGSNVYIYFLPNTAYPMKLWGKFGLTEVASVDFDLSTVYDKFYIEYLRHGLAEYICADYNIQLQPQVQKKLDEIENIIADISPKDFRMRKLSSLQSGPTGYWAAANLGTGWTT
jgi:hypothetical protein